MQCEGTFQDTQLLEMTLYEAHESALQYRLVTLPICPHTHTCIYTHTYLPLVVYSTEQPCSAIHAISTTIMLSNCFSMCGRRP
jgi:hypothetical protein